MQSCTISEKKHMDKTLNFQLADNGKQIPFNFPSPWLSQWNQKTEISKHTNILLKKTPNHSFLRTFIKLNHENYIYKEFQSKEFDLKTVCLLVKPVSKPVSGHFHTNPTFIWAPSFALRQRLRCSRRVFWPWAAGVSWTVSVQQLMNWIICETYQELRKPLLCVKCTRIRKKTPRHLSYTGIFSCDIGECSLLHRRLCAPSWGEEH